MCGFVGIIGNNQSRNEIEKAINVIQHRGPDGFDFYHSPVFSLAACRLAIVPPLSSSAIARSENKKTLLTLNGEIYGLSSTSKKQTTDTENLLELLNLRGTSVVPELNGLFSFCHWDGKKALLARDVFGIKPLYYAHYNGGIAFASEMKALLSLSGFSRDIDQDVQASVEIVGYNILKDQTPFKKIKSLAPGSMLEITINGDLKTTQFRSSPADLIVDNVEPNSKSLNISELEFEEQTEFLLSQSLRRAILHDPNPKTLFLSGGLDSSLLLALSQNIAQISACTLWDTKNEDDFHAACAVSDYFGTNLTKTVALADDLDREIVHYAWHFEHPIAGRGFDLLGGVAFHLLTRKLDSNFKVAFCGEGADELFMGYHRYHMEPKILQYEICEAFNQNRNPCIEEHLSSMGFFDDQDNSKIELNLRRLAAKQGLSEYHLQSVDRTGMAFGVEFRPPYLDTCLAELACSLPEHYFIDRNDYWTKRPLRAILRKYLNVGPSTHTVIRRKRAMAYSLEDAGNKLISKIQNKHPGTNLPNLCLRLFFYLHVDNHFKSCPNVKLSELVPFLLKEDLPECVSC